MIPKKFFVLAIHFCFLINFLAETRSLYLRCFQRLVRRSIDNSQPITELFYISPHQCLDQCILITNNAKKDGLCRSFVYNHLQHSCRLYAHEGTQIPAIIHPANGYDYYRRTAITGECAGPLQRFYDARANANLIPVGAAPKISKPSKQKVIKSFESGAPPSQNIVPNVQNSHPNDDVVVDPKKTFTQSVDLPKKPIEFKEYVDSEDNDYSDFEKNAKQEPVPKVSFGKKPVKNGSKQQFDENYSNKAVFDGFEKSTQSKYEIRPGSTAGLPEGAQKPVYLPNNPSDLGYENPEPPPIPKPSRFDVRPGSTGGLPGGNGQSVHLPNSASELGYVDATTESPSGGYYSRKSTPWRTELPPATRAPWSSRPAPPPRRPPPPPPPPQPTPDIFRPEPVPDIPKPAPQPQTSKKGCSTSTAYYVVIGNEIVLPVTGSENDVRIFHGVEQSKCAQFCSSGKGPSGETIHCSSINYFPLLQKCEIYNILAEPHGPGSLVENDDVIYAEKFCLPSHRGNCQEDEIFILHVQKKITSQVLQVATSNSITSCLQACLNANGCQSASFDSNRRRCSLHSTNIGENPKAAQETDPGWVLIENGCTSRRKSQRIFGASRNFVDVDSTPRQKSSENDQKIDPELEWTEWSSCRFKVAGKKAVRVRTRQCKERCADGGLQIEQC
uniref:Apple domain-containing protein n=1 Tax=Panagrolaimus sp. JU765 TaxID=591449 RepID=A0AC34QDM0_9BILA